MTSYPIHTVESAPPPARPALEGLKKEVGFVPNLAGTMASSPTLIDGFTTLRRLLAQGSFTGVERETISLVVSHENRCTYCVAAHSTFADRQGMAAGALAALRAGRSPDDARLGPLATYTRKLLRQRGTPSPADLEAFLSAGFTAAQALEAIAVISFTMLANYAHNLTDIAVDAAFQPQAWSA
jgi:uncharacterized peroxidase-related enzyme